MVNFRQIVRAACHWFLVEPFLRHTITVLSPRYNKWDENSMGSKRYIDKKL